MTEACQVKSGKSRKMKRAIASIIELIQLERCLMTSEGYLKANYTKELKVINPSIKVLELFLDKIPVKCL